jgi:hypothetical protein
MHIMKTKFVIALVLLLTVAGFALASVQTLQRGGGKHIPIIPSPLCDKIQVPEGNKVAFQVYARGSQVYKWNGAGWDFVAPIATLSASANYYGEVGIHYAGPTWESKSGSKVVARRVDGCTPDPTAIPWLLLEATSTSGPGIFSSITYIQRVNTTGGLIPSIPGSLVGEIKEVPYTAEYFFYRAED